jgi:hypothetical protein
MSAAEILRTFHERHKFRLLRFLLADARDSRDAEKGKEKRYERWNILARRLGSRLWIVNYSFNRSFSLMFHVPVFAKSSSSSSRISCYGCERQEMELHKQHCSLLSKVLMSESECESCDESIRSQPHLELNNYKFLLRLLNTTKFH